MSLNSISLSDNRLIVGVLAGIIALLFERYVSLSHELDSLRSRVTEATQATTQTEATSGFLSYLLTNILLPCCFLAITVYVLYLLIKDVNNIRSTNDKNISVEDVLSYRVDYWLSYSTWSKPMLLVIMIFTLVTFGGIIFAVLTGNTLSGSMWQVWLLIVDTGAHGDFESVQSRVIGLIMTCCGMCVFGFLIGIVTDVIAEKVDQLKKGKSRVIEKGHTLILNWSDKTLPVISELCNANASMGGGIIVLLAEEPKEELEQRIDDSEIDLQGSKVIVRSGSPVLTADLKKVSAQHARATVILSCDKGTPDEDDANTLRTVLSLQGLGDLAGHVVAEIKDVDNREIINICGKDEVEVIVAHDVIGRIMILAAMQPGLALVLDKVLGFEGSEFYMQEWPELVGMTFQEAFFLFPEAVVVGLCKSADFKDDQDSDECSSGEASPTSSTSSTIESMASRLALLDRKRIASRWLHPPPDTVIEEGDKLIVLSEDDDSYFPLPSSRSQAKALLARAQKFTSTHAIHSSTKIPTHLLFNGWRRDIGDMIIELDQYVAPASELTLLSEVPVEQRLKVLADAGIDVNKLNNITIHHSVGSPLSRRHINSLDMTAFDSVLILADETYENDMQKMDSRSLTSLLLIRDINAKHERKLITRHVDNLKSPVVVTDPILNVCDLPASPSETQLTDITSGPNATSPISNKRRDTLNLKLKALSRTGSFTDLFTDTPKPHTLRRSSTSIVDEIMTDSIASLALHVDTKTKSTPPNIIETSQQGLTIISEILDSRTKSLISRSGSSDYVASNELVSKAIAMVAEEKHVGTLLQELLSADGSEIYTRPAQNYVHDGEIVSFWDVSARTMVNNELCIGYVKNMQGHKARLRAALRKKRNNDESSDSDDEGDDVGVEEDEEETDPTDHIVINPQKKDQLMMWSHQDYFIVFAEN